MVHISSARAEKDEWKQLLEQAETIRKLPPKPIPQEQVDTLLSGGECTIPTFNKMVRVFTSSTFTDTEIERNSLMKDVYPYLRKLCSILGLEFHVVDMRWGIREERSNDHGTSTLCMIEVSKCLNFSLSCAFVSFLGDKYGYRPFPAHVDVDELDAIKSYLNERRHPDLPLLDEWYWKDTNNVPPRYVLRPIPDVLTQFHVKESGQSGKWWNEIFPKIQLMLRTAALACLDKSVAHKYVQSVTEEEVFNGILNNPKAAEQTIFFDRKYTNLDLSDKAARLFRDMLSQDPDSEAFTLQNELKERVHSVLPIENTYKYNMDWQARPNQIMDPKLEEFLDIFCRKISTSTLQQYEEQNLDYGTQISEIMHHAATIKAKCSSFVVREELQVKMEEFLESSPSTTPFVVFGESGSGKTSFMAKSAFDAKQKYPNAVVVTRFIGTSSQSSDGRSILFSIASQITQAYGGDAEYLGGDFKELAKLEFLSLATEEKPLIVFLDSLDQMTNDDNARDMSWMPEEGKLPEYVHFVVSTLPKEHGILQVLQSKYLSTPNNFLEVTSLDTQAARSIIMSHLSQVNRTLTPEQLSKVEGFAKECPSPLYIKMVVDLCSKVNSYQSIPDLPTTIKGLINQILAKLERDHGGIVVSHALGYITCARNGLTEGELDDILACDDEVISDLYQWWTPPERRMPPLLWARILSDLTGYLIMRGSRGHSVYAWYHRQWIEAVRERYLESEVKAPLRPMPPIPKRVAKAPASEPEKPAVSPFGINLKPIAPRNHPASTASPKPLKPAAKATATPNPSNNKTTTNPFGVNLKPAPGKSASPFGVTLKSVATPSAQSAKPVAPPSITTSNTLKPTANTPALKPSAITNSPTAKPSAVQTLKPASPRPAAPGSPKPAAVQTLKPSSPKPSAPGSPKPAAPNSPKPAAAKGTDSTAQPKHPQFDLKKAHAAVADYFNGKWGNGKKKPYTVVDPVTKKAEIKEADRLVDPQNLYEAEGIPNIRKLSELPYHQIRCEDYKGLADDSLGYIPFITAKIEAGLIYEMIEEYLQIEAATNNREDETIKEIRLYSHFVRQNAHAFTKDSKSTYQLALNQPNDSTIYKEGRAAIPEKQFFMDWINKSPYPNPTELTIELKGMLRIAEVNVQGTKLAHIGYQEVELFNLRTGATIAKIEIEHCAPACLSFKDGSELYVFYNSKILVYNTDTGGLSSQITILNDPSVPEEKGLTTNSTDYNMYATEKSIIIVLKDTAFMIDIPTTWGATAQYRYHTFTYGIDKSSYQVSTSSTGIVFIDVKDAPEPLADTEETVWYWGSEYKEPVKLYSGTEGRVRPLISRSGKYLAVAEYGKYFFYDSTDKENLVVLWQMDENMMYYTPYFTTDETRIMFANNDNIEYITVKSDKFDRTSEEDVKILVEIGHSNKNLPLVEISPGRYFHASYDACWVTDTRMPPLKSMMENPKFSRDGKSMVYHDVMKGRNAHVVTDLSGKEQKEIFALPSTAVISLSPSFHFAASGYSWEEPPKFVLRSVISSDPIFYFMNFHLLCFSPDEQLVCLFRPAPNNFRATVVAIGKSMQKKIKALSFEVPHGFEESSSYTCTGFSYNNRCLVLNPCRGNLQIVNLVNGKISFFQTTDEKAIAFSHNELYLAIACSNNIKMYNVQDDKLEYAIKVKQDDLSIETVAFSRDSEAVLAGLGSEVRWYAVKDGTLLYRFDLVSPSTSISTTQFSEKILLGDKAGVVYSLQPFENRKLEQGYGVAALQPQIQTAEEVTEEESSYLGRKTQAGVQLVRRIRDWLVDAQMPDKEPKKIEGRLFKHLITHAPPQLIDLTSEAHVEDYTVDDKESGPAFPFWANKANNAKSDDTSLSFAAITKAVTSAVPTPFFTDKGKDSITEFARQIIEIFNDKPKSVEYATLARVILDENPVDKIDDEIRAKKKELEAARDQENEKAKEEKERLEKEKQDREEKEKEEKKKENGDKENEIEVEKTEEPEEEEPEPDIVVEKNEEQLARIKAFGDKLKEIYTQYQEVLTSSDHYDSKYVEENAKKAEDNEDDPLKDFATNLKTLFIALAEKEDPIEEVLNVAKELNEKCPGYLYSVELEVRKEEEYNFDFDINNNEEEGEQVDIDALLASINETIDAEENKEDKETEDTSTADLLAELLASVDAAESTDGADVGDADGNGDADNGDATNDTDA